MRSVAWKTWFGLGIVLALGLSWAVAAAPPDAGAVPPGGIAIGAETTTTGTWMLTVAVGAAEEKLPPPLALLVISLPSGTVLSAQVSDGAPASVLNEAMALAPRATGVGPLEGTVNVTGMPPPPVEDDTLVVKVLKEEQGALAWKVASEAHPDDLAEFYFVIESGGGTFRTCWYCDALFCGCITCATPGAFRCCPGCELSCMPILCP